MRTCNDAIRFRCPVYARDELIVVSESIRFDESMSFLGINVHILAIRTDSDPRPVGIEGKGHDRACKELMRLSSGHSEGGTGWQSTVDQDTIRNDSLFKVESRDRDLSARISGLPGF